MADPARTVSHSTPPVMALAALLVAEGYGWEDVRVICGLPAHVARELVFGKRK